jgi:fructokinase
VDSAVMVMGEALVDLVVPPDPLGTMMVGAALGGAPFNTARVCGRLDAPVSFVGAVSDDRFGTRIVAQLDADGVDAASVQRVPEPTTLAAAEIDDRGAAAYRFYLQGTSAPHLTSVPAPGPNDIVFTGGLGLVLEPMADTITAAILAAPADTLVIVDVNCRPLATPDPDRFRDRVDQVLARADVVKVSDDDLAFLRPGVAVLEAATGIVEQGPTVVLVTRGADGVSIVTATGVVTVPVEPLGATDIVDTIGAGDAFGGGFVSWWVRTGRSRADLGNVDTLRDAVRAANQVARIVCTRQGADPPWRTELPDNWDR